MPAAAAAGGAAAAANPPQFRERTPGFFGEGGKSTIDVHFGVRLPSTINEDTDAEMVMGFTIADWKEKFAAFQFREIQSDFFGNS